MGTSFIKVYEFCACLGGIKVGVWLGAKLPTTRLAFSYRGGIKGCILVSTFRFCFTILQSELKLGRQSAKGQVRTLGKKIIRSQSAFEGTAGIMSWVWDRFHGEAFE
jgi:hypothetical protein